MSKKAIETTENVIQELSRIDFKKKGFKLKKSKKQHLLLITIQDGASRNLEGIKKIKAETTHIKIGDDEYLFDITKDIYTQGLKSFYLLDMNKGQLHLDLGDTYKFNPKGLKKLIREQAITQTLSRMTNQQTKINFFVGIFFALFGGLIGYLIALYSSGVLG
jgi:hypothetical protein